MKGDNSYWCNLGQAAKRLAAGSVVAIPTETVYGLAAAISSEAALRQVFHLKSRPFFDPLIVHVHCAAQARTVVADVPDFAANLMTLFWPGPLTLVLPKASHINPLITAGLETVGVRCPQHPFARRIIERTGDPLAAPSANRFGKTSPTRAEHVLQEWPDGEVFIVDGGPCAIGLESTVVQIRSQPHETIVSVLRPGAVTEKMLQEVAISWPTPVRVERIESVASPGHLEHHYMPAIPLVILDDSQIPLSPMLQASIQSQLKVGSPDYGILQLDADPTIAARLLYDQMRERVNGKSKFIVVGRSELKQGELWDAIWDRLNRAATLKL